MTNLYQRIAIPLCLSALVALSPAHGGAQARGTQAARPITLPLTFEHTLRSQVNGRMYVIQVALPFATARPGGDSLRFPTLYLLDGDWDLPKVAAAVRHPGVGGPSGIVLVGVGYPPGATLGMPPPGGGETAYRLRDYTPPHIPDSLPRSGVYDQHPEMGGAALFLRVLKEEIIPFVERTYPVNADRGLYGHSIGGAFALYVLLEDPDVFSRYAISSASYWWDNRSWLLRERQLWKRRSSLEKRVYVSVGEFESAYEDLERNRLVVALCAGRWEGAYQGLNLISERIPGIGHQSFLHTWYAAQALYPNSANLNPPDPTLPNPCLFR